MSTEPRHQRAHYSTKKPSYVITKKQSKTTGNLSKDLVDFTVNSFNTLSVNQFLG